MPTREAPASARAARRARRTSRRRRRTQPPARGTPARSAVGCSEGGPYPRIRQVDVGYLQVCAVQQSHELVSVDLLLLDNHVCDLLDLVLVVLDQMMRLHVCLPEDLGHHPALVA